VQQELIPSNSQSLTKNSIFMKTKVYVLILITVAAIATLSFTFAAVKTNNSHVTIKAHGQSFQSKDTPIGGLAIEDKL
jgi:hypothetical protein